MSHSGSVMLFAPSGRWVMALAGVCATVLAGPSARAAPPQEPPSRDQLATARELFAQAERDEDAGRWSDALDKLRQVALVKATAGVRYHIALSEERMGLLTNALEDFEGAEEQARAEHAKDVLRLVGGELDGLRPRVPRLALHVTPENLPETVTLDGETLDVARMGESRAVNPGDHTIEVHVAGRLPATVHVTLREGDATSLDIPLVEVPPAPPPSPPARAVRAAAADSTAPVSATWTPARVGAVAATASAAALLATGIAAFVAAGGAHDRGVESCAAVANPAPDACDSQKNTVRAWDWTAAGSWAGTAVAAGLAVYLWTRPGSAPPNAASVTWVLGVGSVGLRGSF
jgi:hypothetical protein